MFELPPGLWRKTALLLLIAFFLIGGAAHFAMPDSYIAIMPPWLPAHREIVLLSGACEIVGAVGLLFAASRRAVGIGLMLLVVAVFPANIHMALHPEQFASLPRWALYARLPLQLAILAWVWWATRSRLPQTTHRVN